MTNCHFFIEKFLYSRTIQHLTIFHTTRLYLKKHVKTMKVYGIILVDRDLQESTLSCCLCFYFVCAVTPANIREAEQAVSAFRVIYCKKSVIFTLKFKLPHPPACGCHLPQNRHKKTGLAILQDPLIFCLSKQLISISQ